MLKYATKFPVSRNLVASYSSIPPFESLFFTIYPLSCSKCSLQLLQSFQSFFRFVIRTTRIKAGNIFNNYPQMKKLIIN